MKAVNVDEVLKILHKYGRYIFVTDEKKYSDMVDEIANLKALEQEPKSEWEQDHAILKAYSDGANEVLDKIRAEIESNMESIIGKYDSSIPKSNMPSYKIERNKAREECISIIDKYKAEAEQVDGNDD